MTCASAYDCWTVGYSFVDGVYRTLIEHWDGAVWSIVSSPVTSTTQNNYLIGLTCVSPRDCRATGYHYDDYGVLRTLVAAYSGTTSAGTVPDRNGAGGPPLLLTRLADGDLMLTWSPSCTSTDTDYVVYEGSIGGAFDNHTSRLCSTAGATSQRLTPSTASAYYLVAPRNADREGSLGRRSDGTERPPGGAGCRPQELGGCLP